MTKVIAHKSKIMKLKVAELSVDPKVQRQLDPRRVRKIAENWDERKVGVLTVSHRVIPDFDEPTEEFVVLDGQTRFRALEIVAEEADVEPLVNCEVFEGLTTADEASMFLGHNDRKAVTPRDLFRLAVAAEEEWALNVRDIAADHGWYVQGLTPADPKNFRVFTAIGAVEKIYRADDGRALRRTFDVLERSWGRKGGVVCSETIYGVGQLFVDHPTGLDAPGLIVKLKKVGLNAYVTAVHDRRRTHPGISIRTAAQQWTRELYNRGRQPQNRV